MSWAIRPGDPVEWNQRHKQVSRWVFWRIQPGLEELTIDAGVRARAVHLLEEIYHSCNSYSNKKSYALRLVLAGASASSPPFRTRITYQKQADLSSSWLLLLLPVIRYGFQRIRRRDGNANRQTKLLLDTLHMKTAFYTSATKPVHYSRSIATTTVD